MGDWWNLVASPAAGKASKDDEDPDQNLATISSITDNLTIYVLLATHPADNLKDKGEEHRSLHAVVGAGRVLKRPVWPTAENHNRPLKPGFMFLKRQETKYNAELISKYVTF